MSDIAVIWRRLAERTRELPPLVVDAIIVAVCWINVNIQAVVEDRLEWSILVLGGVNALPLLWRRRFPFTVTMVTGFTTTWMALDEAAGQFQAAQLVATYTFAALCPPWRRLLAATCTAAGIALSILIPKDEVFNLGVVGIAFGVAYALGTGARARRDRIAMLEERARRLAEQQDAAAARERERIAREMHDIIAHSMSLVVIQAEAGPVAVRHDADKAAEMFDTISGTAREALAQLRRALGVLRSPDEPARRPQPGLDALPELVASIRKANLDVTMEEEGERRPMPPDLAATAYRIVQESLTNTVKHAAAERVWVRLGWRDGALHLDVRDDGRGDEPGNGAGDGAGHGLIGMRERVAAAGGELTFGSGPDGVGFHVAASLPYM